MTSVTSKNKSTLSIFFGVLGIVWLSIFTFEFLQGAYSSFYGLQGLLGVIWLVQSYLYWKQRVRISWNTESLLVKRPGRREKIFAFKNIKNLAMTKNNLIINSGMASGDMIALKAFTDADKELLHATFYNDGSVVQIA